MKARIFLSFLALVLVGSSASAQDNASVQAAVEDVMQGFVAARNARDAEAAAKHFADDYDQGNLSTGSIQIRSGKERYEAYRAAFMEGRLRNEMETATTNFRQLTENVALLDAELKFKNDSGQQQLTNFATFVFIKRDGQWLIGAVRLSPVR